MMFETALQRLFDDLVVTMIFAFVPKRALPCVAILQLSARNGLRHALRERNGVCMLHWKKIPDRRMIPHLKVESLHKTRVREHEPQSWVRGSPTPPNRENITYVL